MAKVIFGNHSSVIVPRQDRDGIRNFYCGVLAGPGPDVAKVKEALKKEAGKK
jgi:hypothetical protein